MSLAFFPIYPGDYLADTMHLSTEEHGAYFLLLLAYYKQGGPLPDDDKKLAAITRLSLSDWQNTRPALSEFFEIKTGMWLNRRADKEIAKALALQVARAKGAKATNALRRSASAKRPAQRALRASDCGSGSGSGSESSLGRSGNPLPAELPPRFPETQDAAVPAAGVACKAPEVFIRELWSKAASRGGRDSKDVPIRSWADYVSSQWGFDQDRRAKEAANRPPPREMSAREIRKAHIIK